jgi:hypothetical protein
MMNTGKAFFYSANTVRHTTESEFSLAGLTVANLPRVAIVYSHADLGGETVAFLVSQGVRGIVLAGVGDGNSTDAVIAALEQAAKQGVAVVRCSRVGSGVVDRNVEVNDDNSVSSPRWSSALKARILLMLSDRPTWWLQQFSMSMRFVAERANNPGTSTQLRNMKSAIHTSISTAWPRRSQSPWYPPQPARRRRRVQTTKALVEQLHKPSRPKAQRILSGPKPLRLPGGHARRHPETSPSLHGQKIAAGETVGQQSL